MAVALAAWLLWAFGGEPLIGLAQGAADLKPIERDELRGQARYQVTLHVGATLWDIANTYLPLVGLEQGDARAYQVVLDNFQRAFPGRQPGAVRPDDTFTLEVPLDTFVTEKFYREGSALVFRSFQGDELTYYPKHPALSYRLVRHDLPDKAEISLTGQGSSAVDLAREIYQLDSPDFIQVRMVRAALNDKAARVVVDLAHKYLDDFRNYRERATRVDSGESGLKAYVFGPETDTPFVQVEDAVGDGTDPGVFPREFRVAYYRDGTVKRYLVTEPGDALAALSRPDPARWQKVLTTIKDWQEPTIEPLVPFSPAVNQMGSLLPGRLLVLSFSPRVAAQPTASASARPTSSTARADLKCLGVPLAMILALIGGALRLKGIGIGWE